MEEGKSLISTDGVMLGRNDGRADGVDVVDSVGTVVGRVDGVIEGSLLG